MKVIIGVKAINGVKRAMDVKVINNVLISNGDHGVKVINGVQVIYR